MYKVDFKRLAIHLLPTFLRQPLIFGVLRAGLAAVESAHSVFLDRRAGHIYRLTHNGQVCHLTAALNDNFDPTRRRFRIMTVERQGEWLYAIDEEGTNIPLAYDEGKLVAEGEGVSKRVSYVGGDDVPIVYDEVMLNAAQNSFVVYVPYDIYQTRLDAVRTLVDQYKLVTKRAIYKEQSASVTGVATGSGATVIDVMDAYRYGYISAELSTQLKEERKNIISNADSRIYKR